MASQKKVKPSFTAFLIPKILPALAAKKKYATLLTKPQIELSRCFARECAKRDLGIAMVNYLTFKRPAIWLANNMGVKGLPVHYAARKKFIRNKLDESVNEIGQVVVVGAGFDTLALEYSAKYPDIKFYEIDRKPTQDIKVQSLVKTSNYKDTKVNFISADLSEHSLSDVLLQSGFNPAIKSFVVVEGVLPYLEKKSVEQLFERVLSISALGSYMVIGSMFKLENEGDARAKLSDTALKARKEKYKFAESPAGIRTMLKTAGFDLIETKLYHELQHNIENEDRVRELQKERGEHYYLAKKI